MKYNYKYYSQKSIKRDDQKYVNFRLLDEGGNIIKDFRGAICFAQIWRYDIPNNCTKIELYRNLSEIPYNLDIIEKWIKDINELGFICQFNINNEDTVFIIELKNFKYKLALNITLQLIRLLWERGCSYAVDHYFFLLENKKETDKFIAMQESMKMLNDNNDAICQYDAGHIPTSKGNSEINVNYKDFLSKLECTGTNLYSSTSGWNNVNALFR